MLTDKIRKLLLSGTYDDIFLGLTLAKNIPGITENEEFRLICWQSIAANISQELLYLDWNSNDIDEYEIHEVKTMNQAKFTVKWKD